MTEQQESRPILDELIDKAKFIFWSKNHIERNDNLFEGYFETTAADDAVAQSGIDAIAQLPSVLAQTRIKPSDIFWVDVNLGLEPTSATWEGFCRTIVSEIISKELQSDPTILIESERRYDATNV